MDAARKRTRTSKTVRHMHVQRALEARIAGALAEAARRRLPIQPIAFQLTDEIKDRCDGVKLPVYRRDNLWHYKRGIIDLLTQIHARWQLYIDGQPRTSDEISDMREAGDENVWQRVHGRMEWDDTDRPFYEDVPPAKI